MRLAAGGISIESCTFSPLPSKAEDFEVRKGAAQLERYPFLDKLGDEVTVVPTLHARALPGGVVEREVYENLKNGILEGLAEVGSVDGFYLDIHGAMNVEGMDDAEGDLATSIRLVLGDLPMAASMDLHGNVSARLVEAVDSFTAYRTAPHIDYLETREKAVRLLITCVSEGIRPKRAFVPVPVLLPGESTSTMADPGRSLYAQLAETDSIPGVMDASIWVGYVWADEPRSHAAIVVTGTDEEAIRGVAEDFAGRYWRCREDFRFGVPAGTAEWCIEESLKVEGRSVFISDSGDNPTAGGAGDTTTMLKALVGSENLAKSGERALFVSIPDPVAVAACFEAGIGEEITLEVGGKLDPVHSHPLQIAGRVANLHVGDPVAVQQAVVEVGTVSFVLTERRKPFHYLEDFRVLGIDLDSFKIVSVKIGYLVPELEEAANSAFLALTAGAVNQDIPSLSYQRIPRPFFPLDRAFDWKPKAVIFG